MSISIMVATDTTSRTAYCIWWHYYILHVSIKVGEGVEVGGSHEGELKVKGKGGNFCFPYGLDNEC